MDRLLIAGGTVFDGTGAPSDAIDVRIADGRLVEMGHALQPRPDEQVINANGAIVAPGFIDSHTHFDATIFWDPICDPMPQHGVTSVVFGNCALSLAPIRADQRVSELEVLSYIEDLPLDLLVDSVPWEWETFGDYVEALSRRSFGVNVCGFVGHSQIRSYVMGGDAWTRAATAAETVAIADVLDDAMRNGALGMSYSLFDKDKKGRPVPSCLAEDAELDALFAVLRVHGGTFQFVLAGNTTEETLDRLGWLAGFMERHDVAGLYNVVAHVNSDPMRSTRVLACLEALQARGVRLFGMATPRPFELQIAFNQTIAFIQVAAWDEIVQAPIAEKRRLIDDPEWRARARAQTDACESATFPFYQPELLRIGMVGRPELQDWCGRPFADLLAEHGGHLIDVVADWLIENEFATTFIFPIANTQPAAVGKILGSPTTLVSGSDAGAHLQMFCAAGDSTLLLTRHVMERGDLSLAAAIHELTGKQAAFLGLVDRGMLAPGMAADVVIFALDELHYGSDYLMTDIPGGQPRLTRPPGGYRYTIVNGTVVQKDGQATGALPARRLAMQSRGTAAAVASVATSAVAKEAVTYGS